MTEHDQRVCPRCGAPAGDYRFCPSCRGHIESLTGIPARAAARPADADSALQSPAETIRLEQALVRLEQAMAAASRMSGDRVAGSAPAALEVDSAPPPTTESRQPAPEVARLEDVLTVASPPRQETIEDLPQPAPLPHLSPSADVRTPEPPAAPATARTVFEREPSYVDAQALREAFWFELASATSVPPPVAADEPKPMSIAPPVANVAPKPGSVAPPVGDASPGTTPSVVRVWAEQTSQKSWATALCLLTLIALVVLLTGRVPRGVGGQKRR